MIWKIRQNLVQYLYQVLRQGPQPDETETQNKKGSVL